MGWLSRILLEKTFLLILGIGIAWFGRWVVKQNNVSSASPENIVQTLYDYFLGWIFLLFGMIIVVTALVLFCVR